MKLDLYEEGENPFWMGCILSEVEDKHETIGFVKHDGTIVWAWELRHKHFERKVDGKSQEEGEEESSSQKDSQENCQES